MKKRKVCIIVLIIVILVCVFCFVINKRYFKNDGKQLDDKTESEIKFTPTEKYLANKIKDEFERQKYVDSQKTKSFKIIKFQQYGYFKSQSNIRYIYVTYEYECKDETMNCINIPYVYNYEDKTFMIVIDLNDQKYLKFQKGFSTTIDKMDDLVQDYIMPEYSSLKL